MVVDYKKFHPGSPLPDSGLFMVLEQIPCSRVSQWRSISEWRLRGTVVMRDQTQHLKSQQHWPSYNVPFYPEVFNRSGSWANVAKYGDWFTYDKTPRALIFKRDVPNVRDLESLRKLMRSNNYLVDPLSRCNCTPPYSAENAISARCDLNPINGTYPFGSLGHRSHGGVDMKATSAELMKGLGFVAVSGPTWESPMPVFKWSEASFPGDTPHYAHPDQWRFHPITVHWGCLAQPL